MNRITPFVSPVNQQHSLSHLGSQGYLSTAEINYPAIDNVSHSAKTEVALAELELLATTVIQLNKKAEKAILDAHKAVKKTLNYFQTKRKNME